MFPALVLDLIPLALVVCLRSDQASWPALHGNLTFHSAKQ